MEVLVEDVHAGFEGGDVQKEVVVLRLEGDLVQSWALVLLVAVLVLEGAVVVVDDCQTVVRYLVHRMDRLEELLVGELGESLLQEYRSESGC